MAVCYSRGYALQNSEIGMSGLIWFLIEVVIAVALLAGIVWWTWPRREADKSETDNKE